MLKITIAGVETFNEETGEFSTTKDQELSLEHSLVSLSKWESKWCKPFISREERTYEQMIDYVRCMTLTQNVDPLVYHSITKDDWTKIHKYIEAPMTATTISERPGKTGTPGPRNREVLTSELIYYYMIAYGIPWEAQKWHLNRLIMLIRVCAEKESKQQKMSKKDVMARNHSLNAARRARLGTKG